MEKGLLFKCACKDDARDIFDLANDPLVRKSSFNSSKISWDEHLCWFNKIISNTDFVLYVVRNENNNFVGTVRFEKYQSEKKIFVIGVQLRKPFRGKGLGKLLILGATRRISEDLGVEKIIAYIKKENIISLKLFLKLGYLVERDGIKNSCLYWKMGYYIKDLKQINLL